MLPVWQYRLCMKMDRQRTELRRQQALRRRAFPEATAAQWADWHWQLRHRVRTAEALDRMLDAAEKAGVQFAVGQAVRFWPEYVKTKQLYDAGALGTVKYARASRLSVHPAWSEWYRKPENSGGGLFDGVGQGVSHRSRRLRAADRRRRPGHRASLG